MILAGAQGAAILLARCADFGGEDLPGWFVAVFVFTVLVVLGVVMAAGGSRRR